jgi:alpha-beta hydrolase superfamily lysophospholipase
MQAVSNPTPSSLVRPSRAQPTRPARPARHDGPAGDLPGAGEAPPPEPSVVEKRIVGALVKAVFFRGRRGGPWEPPLGMDVSEVRFAGNSGARLHGWHVRHAEPRGIVVLAHPDRRYGKQWFAREGWLSWLHGHGFDSLAFDFPVYGESGGGSTYLHEDVAAACRLARQLRPGLPVHVVGLSIGAFASLNAAVALDFVEGLVLESPYPTFEAWYQGGKTGGTGGAGGAGGTGRPRGHGRANALLGRLFPKTYRRIDAGANAPAVRARRILVAGTSDDEVTPIHLTREVASLLPAGRTETLELAGVRHLGLFQREEYREAVLRTLSPPATEPAMAAVQPSSAARRSSGPPR